MANICIIHGSGGTSQTGWIPNLHERLEADGNTVWAPDMPNTDSPDREEWLAYLNEHLTLTENSIVIGHSIGVPAILSLLERSNTSIAKAVLVAGFYKLLGHGPEPFLQDSYNWEKIRSNAKDFVIINSDDDPWGCDSAMGRGMWEKLGGAFVGMHGHGHFGSDKFNQPYKNFDLLYHLITADIQSGLTT